MSSRRSCHPFLRITERSLNLHLISDSMLADAGSGALSALTSYARGDLGGVFKSITGVGKRLATGNSAQQKTKATKSSQADVISWSGW